MENPQPIDIILPVELANGALTLEEIGTIFVLTSISHQFIDHWKDDADFRRILLSLKNEGIVSMKDGELEIDLTWI